MALHTLPWHSQESYPGEPLHPGTLTSSHPPVLPPRASTLALALSFSGAFLLYSSGWFLLVLWRPSFTGDAPSRMLHEEKGSHLALCSPPLGQASCRLPTAPALP